MRQQCFFKTTHQCHCLPEASDEALEKLDPNKESDESLAIAILFALTVQDYHLSKATLDPQLQTAAEQAIAIELIRICDNVTIAERILWKLEDVLPHGQRN